jgi:hypothetical protein
MLNSGNNTDYNFASALPGGVKFKLHPAAGIEGIKSRRILQISALTKPTVANGAVQLPRHCGATFIVHAQSDAAYCGSHIR